MGGVNYPLQMRGFPHELDVYQKLQGAGCHVELVCQSGRYQGQTRADLLVDGFTMEVKKRKHPFRLFWRWLKECDILWVTPERGEEMVILKANTLLALLEDRRKGEEGDAEANGPGPLIEEG